MWHKHIPKLADSSRMEEPRTGQRFTHKHCKLASPKRLLGGSPKEKMFSNGVPLSSSSSLDVTELSMLLAYLKLFPLQITKSWTVQVKAPWTVFTLTVPLQRAWERTGSSCSFQLYSLIRNGICGSLGQELI